MAKKKRYRGHYCKVCNSILANEKFSGRGHSKHICKKCSKLPVEEREEMTDIGRIYGLYRYMYLSKANRQMLESYLCNKSEKVRSVAKKMIDEFEETARNIRLDEELYEEEFCIDPGIDEFLDDDQEDSDLNDLHKIYGQSEFDIDGDDEDLPF